MIVDAIVSTVLGFLTSLLSLVPSWGSVVFASGTDWGQALGGALGPANALLPLGAIVACLLISLGVMAAASLFDLALFIYHQVWGSS